MKDIHMGDLDPRTNPFRSDIAASYLRGEVIAKKYVEGEPHRIIQSIVPLRMVSSESAPIDTELLFGEDVIVYENTPDGWSWVQNHSDNYVGWLRTECLGPSLSIATHFVSVLRTYLYPEPELRMPAVGLLSLGTKLTIVDVLEVRGNSYAILEDGRAVVRNHIRPIERKFQDFVGISKQFVGTPYLWGGRTSIGLDCSALIQLSLEVCGQSCPRDSDMQEKEVGYKLDISNGIPQLLRGDLIFWKGHVAITIEEENLLHANGYTMSVATETIESVIARMEEEYSEKITSVRRLKTRSCDPLNLFSS